MDTASNTPLKRRGNACKRCRQQKIKCDGATLSCSNCTRVKAECIRAQNTSPEYVQELEKRLRELEARLQSGQQDDLNPAQLDLTAYSPNQALPSKHVGQAASTPGHNESLAHSTPASTDSHIGPSQPLAHDVGLLSLGNTGEPKYLGPSSGVTFARLIYAAAPQSQGLNAAQAKAALTTAYTEGQAQSVKSKALPEEAELHYFLNAYFDTWHPFYPFLDEAKFEDVIANVYARQNTSADTSASNVAESIMDSAQVFLVLAIGSRVLETRLGSDFNSGAYYATSMKYVDKLQLHDSLRGVQTLLLLVISSFSFSQGLNAWFLLSTIIASCLDLGLQRRQLRHSSCTNHVDAESITHENDRSAVFWSAYSLERNLSVILGRPLTLRDEALDIEFPGQQYSDEVELGAMEAIRVGKTTRPDFEERPAKRIRIASQNQIEPVTSPAYQVANFSFRLDRITAEIKLSVYRVQRSPRRFPWPTITEDWQKEVQSACTDILTGAEQSLRKAGRRSDYASHSLKLKYHQCLMILYRPSPAFPEPSTAALQNCYSSAVEILRIHAEMNRFGTLVDSWLTAHAVFTSGITMLYCLWLSPDIRSRATMSDLVKYANACTSVLDRLGTTWTVAFSAREKFERLVHITTTSWKKGQLDATSNVNGGTSTQPWAAHTTTAPVDPLLDGTLPNDDFFASLLDEPLVGDFLPAPDLIMNELGDMSSWFDLDWLGDANYTNVSLDP